VKPSPVMKTVLDKLIQGYALAQDNGGRVSGDPIAWFPDFYDSTKRFGGKYVSMATFKALRNRGWIEQTEYREGISTYAITQQGREAVKS
jgi:hypothetical protein